VPPPGCWLGAQRQTRRRYESAAVELDAYDVLQPVTETTGTNREQRAYRRAANAAQTRPARRPHGHPALQQMAADQRKRAPSRYLSSSRAMTTRWIWLVPS
jgi:hypothetical protein